MITNSLITDYPSLNLKNLPKLTLLFKQGKFILKIASFPSIGLKIARKTYPNSRYKISNFVGIPSFGDAVLSA
jgi:hypothetical protein